MVGGPVAEEDEPVVVSVHDKGAVLSKVSEPLDSAVGMKNAVGKGELGAGGVDEIEERNGERSDGGICVELEGAGGPVLLFSADCRRLAIVWDVRPDLDCRAGVGVPVCQGRGEGELAGVGRDVQDRGLVEGWAERNHGKERMDGWGEGRGRTDSRRGQLNQRLAADTRDCHIWATRHNRPLFIVLLPIDACWLNTTGKWQDILSSLSLSFSLSW